MAFHENLRILRLAKGLTQPALAEQAGIEQSYLSKLENGRSMPSDEVLKRLADALGSAPEEMMRNGDDGEPAPAWRRFAWPAGAAAALIAGVVGGWLLRDVRLTGTPPADASGMSLAERFHALAPQGVKLDEVRIASDGEEIWIKGRSVDRNGVTEYLGALRQAGIGEAKSLALADDDRHFEALITTGAGRPRGDGDVQAQLARLAGDGVEVRTVMRRPEGGWYVAGWAADAAGATEFMGRVERAGFGVATRRQLAPRGARTEFEFVAGAPE